MSDELPWLSLTEAAAMSGLARETVRARARRGLIPSRKGNDGHVVVQLPPGAVPTVARGQSADVSDLIADLSAEAAELRERLARVEGEADWKRQAAAAELAAAEAVRRAEVTALRELVDREREISRELRTELDAARRPWWRRLIG